MKSGEKRQQSVIIDDTAMQAEVKTEYLQNSFRVRFLKWEKKKKKTTADTDGPNLLKTVGLQQIVQYSQHNHITHAKQFKGHFHNSVWYEIQYKEIFFL